MGSLHCAGMCGPLVLMTPVVGHSRASRVASRVLYHLGRITTYALIGLLFGMIGKSIVFAGLQRWLSLVVGMLMLVILLAAIPLKAELTRIPVSIKALFGKFFRQRSYSSIFALGATNGLLPCGLVYMAATASIATGAIASAAVYMILFGMGTLPMLLAISFAGQRLNLVQFPILQKLAPFGAVVVALLLIVRAQPLTLFSPQSDLRCPACLSSR
jgi:sulfite exporter TauE/SafE